jgi:predicted RNA-binding protein with PIN domain
MRVIIDGYNLLFAVGRLGPRSGKPALEGARRWLVQQLGQGATAVADVTVVFDGYGRAEAAGSSVGGETPPNPRVGVVFSRGESADDVIEELIRAEPAPRRLTVVSDDHRLKQAARRRGCAVLGCLDYIERLGEAPRGAAEQPPEETKPDAPAGEEAERWRRAFGDGGDDPLLRDPF